MGRFLKVAAVAMALLGASPALAVDTSFYTYDGFAEMETASPILLTGVHSIVAVFS